jgi:hypothetical protein
VRITRSGGKITIRDRPGPSWGLGLFLLGGGVLAMAAPLGLATNAGELQLWERLASFGIGLGVSGGAVWWLQRSPGTRVEADRIMAEACGSPSPLRPAAIAPRGHEDG